MGEFLSVLHVLAAVFLVGPMAILPMTGMRLVRAGEPGPVASLAKSVNIFTLLSLAVVVTGLGILVAGSHGFTAFTRTWIWLSTVLTVLAFLLTLFEVVPGLRTAARELAAVPAGPARPAASDLVAVTMLSGPAAGKVSTYSRIAMSSGIASTLLVIVTVLMVWKPSF